MDNEKRQDWDCRITENRQIKETKMAASITKLSEAVSKYIVNSLSTLTDEEFNKTFSLGPFVIMKVGIEAFDIAFEDDMKKKGKR